MSRRPDFLIVGAMKAGTTSMHHMLHSHPAIWLPSRELFFFSGDDFEEHSESFVARGTWKMRDFDAEFDAAWPEYLAHFADAPETATLGDDSTSYLTAPAAPERIAQLLPDARIIVCLRDPVDRLISHYGHLLRSGRAVMPLPAAMLGQRGTLLRRSTYTPGLRRYLDLFGRDRVHIVLFEQFREAPAQSAAQACSFLGVEASEPLDAQHRHAARSARWPAVQMLANWQRRRTGWTHPHQDGRSLLDRLAGTERVEGGAPVDEDTRAFLGQLLRKRNAGLDDLVDWDLVEFWPSWSA